VQRAHHRAEAADGEEGDDELDAVRQLHRHHFAGRDAGATQALGKAKDPVFQLFPGQCSG